MTMASGIEIAEVPRDGFRILARRKGRKRNGRGASPFVGEMRKPVGTRVG